MAEERSDLLRQIAALTEEVGKRTTEKVAKARQVLSGKVDQSAKWLRENGWLKAGEVLMQRGEISGTQDKVADHIANEYVKELERIFASNPNSDFPKLSAPITEIHPIRQIANEAANSSVKNEVNDILSKGHSDKWWQEVQAASIRKAQALMQEDQQRVLYGMNPIYPNTNAKFYKMQNVRADEPAESLLVPTPEAIRDAAKKNGYTVEAFNGFVYPEGSEPGPVYGRGKVNNVGDLSIGFYFQSSKDLASSYAEQTENRGVPYAGKVNHVFLSVKNPLVLDKEILTGSEMVAALEEKGVKIPSQVLDRWEWWRPGGLDHRDFVWKWLNAAHLGRGQDWNESLKREIEAAGYDSIQHPDNSAVGYGVEGDNTATIVFNPEQIKSADPVTYDANGKPIPLSQRFNTTNPSILYQSPEIPADALHHIATLVAAQIAKNPNF
jgi:hypothetical protein